jgi:hypothetical protein
MGLYPGPPGKDCLPLIDLPIKKKTLYKRLQRKIKGKTYIRPFFDDNKCIFIHVPKVAGTSIKNILFPGSTGIGHKLAMDYYLDAPEKFEKYFVFAFVRNPYDRLVSAYNYLMQGGKGGAKDIDFRDRYLTAYEDFTDFVVHGLNKPEMASYWHFMQQHYYVVNFRGEIMVDFIGHFETLEEDFNKVAQRLGVDVTLPHTNKSIRHTYQSYYTDETRRIAYEYYKKDFELLGYPEEL